MRRSRIETKKRDTMVCPECGGYFTPSGLEMHRGSKKCELRVIARPLQEKVDAESQRLELSSKTRVYKNVATAIVRRGLTELCGLEKARTKLYQTDLECKILEEYWVHDWVYRLWRHHNRSGYTRRAYATLESINKLPDDERDSEIGLILLRMLNNGESS